IKLAVAFLAVFSEMFRQMFVSLAMNSDEFETLQELKIFEETAELSLKGLSEEEIEAEFD
ncbi:MAG: hypothetical protein GWN01_04960, partial [Nitrosopumilaceae archaeon]|nr:hypothetical protein [Nitrosopumilaceae archaeon]NIU86698.1 hypothetical protein [Nitrosopumilaceae archaeon]NIV65395.1 hypothetical protein [Nitrosopumilaceae archaeon]NIX60895.1 hypothetical protein [Nitrosopumilaceae archaeon]